MQFAEISKQLQTLTKQTNIEQSLQILLPEYLKLRIFFLKSQIAQYELKWGMNYEEFEKESVNMPDGFTEGIEKEYYEWGEKTALLQLLQQYLKEWN